MRFPYSRLKLAALILPLLMLVSLIPMQANAEDRMLEAVSSYSDSDEIAYQEVVSYEEEAITSSDLTYAISIKVDAKTYDFGDEVEAWLVFNQEVDYDEIQWSVYDIGTTYEEVYTETNTNTTFTWTPEKGGNYYVAAGLYKDGEYLWSYGSSSFVVRQGLYPVGISLNKEMYQLGETVTMTLQTGGTGSITKFQAEILDSSWQSVATLESTTNTITFTPETGGTYHLEASLTNSDGITYDVNTYTEFVVRVGVYPTRVDISPNEIDLGESVTIQVATVGTGGVESVTYTVRDDDTGAIVDQWTETTTTTTYTPSEGGSYYCQASLTNSDGYTYSTYGYSLSVRDGIYPTDVTVDQDTIDLGESFTFNVETAGSGEITNILYELVETTNYTTIASYNTTDTTWKVTPGQGGQMYIRAAVTNDKGMTYNVYCHGLTVRDGAYPTALATDKSEYALGEPVTFTVQTKGTGSIKSIYYEVYDNSTGLTVASKNSTDTTWTWTANAGGGFGATAIVTNDQGYTYSVYCNSHFVVYAGLYPTKLTQDKHEMPLGESVTLTVETAGTGSVANVHYEVHDQDSYALIDSWDSTETTCTYTPEKGGDYFIVVSLTNDQGYTYEVYGNVAAYDGAYPESVTFSKDLIDLGESIEVTVNMAGTGSYTSIRYVFNRSAPSGMSSQQYVIESTDTTVTFTPKAGGEYYCFAYVTNDKGYTYSNYSSPSLTVRDGLYVSNVTSSANVVKIGEKITFTPETAGEGSATEVTYTIIDTVDWNTVYTTSGTLDGFTYVPTASGSYYCQVYMANDRGSYSYYNSWFDVTSGGLYLEAIMLEKETYKVGEPIKATLSLSGTGTIAEAVYSVYCSEDRSFAESELVSSISNTNSEFTFIPNKAGNWLLRVDMTNSDGESWYQGVLIVVEEGDAVEPRKVAALVSDKTEYALGETVVVTAEMTGESEIEAMEYHVYNSQGQQVTGYSGISGTYSFVPSAADTYIVRVYMKSVGGEWHSVDSAPVTVKAPAPEVQPLYIESITADKEVLKVREMVTFKLNFVGEGNPTFMRFYTYDQNGNQIGFYEGIAGEYYFIPSVTGTYAIRVFMYTDVEPDNLQVITSPWFTVTTDNPLHIESITADKEELKVNEMVTFKLNFAGDGNPTFMRFYTYDQNGTEIGFYEGIAGEYYFIPSITGTYAIRVFMYTDVEPENLQVITSPWFTVTADEEEAAEEQTILDEPAIDEPILDGPSADEPVIDEPSAEEPEIPEEPAEPETSEEPEEPEVPEVPEEPEESVTEDEGSEPEVETEEEISEETPEVTQKETSEETTEEPSEEPSEEVPESEITE